MSGTWSCHSKTLFAFFSIRRPALHFTAAHVSPLHTTDGFAQENNSSTMTPGPCATQSEVDIEFGRIEGFKAKDMNGNDREHLFPRSYASQFRTQDNC
jgi:hypothetical protein